MKKKLVSLIVSSVVCFSIGFGLVAQGEELPEVGIIEYKQEGNEAGILHDNVSPVGQGEILTKESVLRSAPLPEKYDPRGGPFDTGVRDQGQLGLCWAYTGTDLISIAARKQLNQTKVYSPNYFNYLSAGNAFSSTEVNPRSEMSIGSNGLKNLRKLDTDGNSSDYVALISMLEEKNVLDTTLGTPKGLNVNLPIDTNQFSSLPVDSAVYLDSFSRLPEVTVGDGVAKKEARIARIKELTHSTGAVEYEMNSTLSIQNYYNEKNKGSYVPTDKVQAPINHAMVIVGWDDTYKKENFKTVPTKDGAFIVKNTWGTGTGDGGYYYVSYDDYYILTSKGLAMHVVDKKSTDKTYGYTNSSAKFYMRSTSNTVYLRNSFTTGEIEETLSSVSFESPQDGLSYDVYLAKTGDLYLSDMLFLEKMDGVGAGFHNVEFEAQKLAPSTEFSIVLVVSKQDSMEVLEYRAQSVSDRPMSDPYPKLEEGNSSIGFINYYGKINWKNASNGELHKKKYYYNLYINAHTAVKQEKKIEGLKLSSAKSIQLNEKVSIEASFSPEDADTKKLTWSSLNPALVSVTDQGEVTGVGEGTTVITATTADGEITASCVVTVIGKNPIQSKGVYVTSSNYKAIPVGGTRQLDSQVFDHTATDKNVTYKLRSDAVGKITVTEDGLVTGLVRGFWFVEVYPNDGGPYSYTMTKVGSGYISDRWGSSYIGNGDYTSIPVTGLKITEKEINLKVNESYDVLANTVLLPEDASNKYIVFNASDSNIVTVENDTRIIGKKTGKVLVTGLSTDGMFTDSIWVNVTE